uniref:Uncharacterized protein n=1 Tax=Desertifilum tharense IPPAS B-1220 TaxID=1781255 RepID=A0ACD5GZY8_9CYAN
MLTINSALYSPHLPTSPSPHPLPHSELDTRYFALLSPTLFPTQHSALSTQHLEKHSALREALPLRRSSGLLLT